MASVVLAKPDLSLFVDPEARVVLPHLIAAPRTRTTERALVRFEGYEVPHSFRGEGRSRTYDLTCRYGADEHDQIADLLGLLAAADDGADGRLALRTNFWTAAGLDLYEIIAVTGDVQERQVGGTAWDIVFPVETVYGTLEV